MRKLRQVLIGVVVFVIAFGLVAAPAVAQPPEIVKVLIGFDRQPGPDEEAIVRGVGGTIKYTYHLVPAIAASIPETAIQGLLRNPRVTAVEPDIAVYAIDAELDNAWGVKRIGAGTVHSYNKGTGIKVAIIDTGIDWNHPDLNANYRGGYDFVNSDNDPMDDNGHGTHVAGIVAAEDDGSGVVGVAPEVGLYALKVLGANGSGRWSDVIAALQWAVDNKIQVTNNSYGSSVDPGVTVKAAFDNAYAAGVLHVAAAGNSGNKAGTRDNVIYPARWESVIAVAATDQSDSRATWSSTGPAVELAAPGVYVYSTYWDDTYKTVSGTSMASPHVAGTAALVMVAYPGWTNVQVRSQLQKTADDLGAAGKDNLYGYGLVDADEAAPQTGVPAPSLISPNDGARINDTTPTFDWSDVTDATYTLQLDDTQDFSSLVLEKTGLTASEYTLVEAEALSEGTYYWHVKAIVGTNESAWSSTWSFTVDTTAPTVTGTSPVNGATNVSVTTNIEATFSEAMDKSSVQSAFSITPSASGSFSWSGNTMIFDPTDNLAYETSYTVTITTGAKDLAGNPLSTDYSWSFATEAKPPAKTMYVQSITFSSKVAGPNKTLYTTVKVVDGGGIALSGVRVEMTLKWTSYDGTKSSSWNFAGDTKNSTGEVKFTLLKAPSGYYTATVTNLILTDYTWDKTKGVTSASCELKDNGTVIQ